jgi:cyclophilin family peptidyl-prolyl cis-trans isomerase
MHVTAKKRIFLLSFVFFFLFLGMQLFGQTMEDPSNPVCRIKTNYGSIEIELFEHAAPKTVANFLGLAAGTKSYIDENTGEEKKGRFYDGLTFHRVIDEFMVQGGDPTGDGTGGPGYTFRDEISADALGLDEIKAIDEQGAPHQWLLVRTQEQFNQMVLAPLFQEMGITSQEELESRQEEFTERINTLTLQDVYENIGYQYDDSLSSYKPMRGFVAMANSGPNTNGSQFFINLIDTPWLTGKHTVFGKVIKGMDVVDQIGKVETNENNKPVDPVKIISVRRID